MKYTVKKLEKNQVEFTFKLSAEEWELAIEEAYNKTKHKYAYQGFRKGKVPRRMIEGLYGEGVFYEDALNNCFPKYYGEALDKEKDVFPVARPDIDVKSIDKAKGVEFVAITTVKPEVTLGEFSGIEYKSDKFEVAESDVDAEIKKAQEKLARMVAVENRAVKNHDMVVIDYSGSVDGTKFEGGTAEKQQLVIGSNSFIPGFEKQVIGMKIGEDKDITVTFPKDYNAKDLAGKEAVFAIKLHEIKEKQLPKIDDDFAKDVSEFSTLAEYKADVMAKLTESKKKEAETQSENDLMDRIVAKATMELPEIMIENEIDEMIEGMKYRFQSQGLKFEDYLKYTGTELSVMRKSYKEQAEKNVKTRLVVDKIVKEQKLEAGKAEINAKIKEISKNISKSVDEVKELLAGEQMNYIKNEIVMDKLFAFLKENNKATLNSTLAEEIALAKKTEKAVKKDAEKTAKAKTEKKEDKE